MNKIDRANLVVLELEKVLKTSEVVVNQLFPELKASGVNENDELEVRFIAKAQESLGQLKDSVDNLEELLKN